MNDLRGSKMFKLEFHPVNKQGSSSRVVLEIERLAVLCLIYYFILSNPNKSFHINIPRSIVSSGKRWFRPCAGVF
jgi:hypothetical protein